MNNAAVVAIAGANRRNPSEVAIRWVAQLDLAFVLRTRDPGHGLSALLATYGNWRLNDTEMSIISAQTTPRGVPSQWGYCCDHRADQIG